MININKKFDELNLKDNYTFSQESQAYVPNYIITSSDENDPLFTLNIYSTQKSLSSSAATQPYLDTLFRLKVRLAN